MSATDVNDYSELRGGVDFSLAQPVMGTRVSFGLDLRQRDYARSRYDPTGRTDTEMTAHLNMVFTELGAYGFNPTVSVTSSQTESSVDLFDSDRLGLRLGIQSSF